MSKSFQVFFVYSFKQASPRLWEYMDVDGVMLSADDAWGRAEEAKKIASTLPCIMDSGGYRFLSRGSLSMSPEQVMLIQEIVKAVPVSLDYPLPPGASDFEDRMWATLRLALHWQRKFGDDFILPVHGHSLDQLQRFADNVKHLLPTVKMIGLGSLAPISRKNPRKALQIIAAARNIFPNHHLHVFGIGNSLLAHIAAQQLADSADTSSHIQDARFGLMRHPETLQMVVVAPRKTRSRPTAKAEEIAEPCTCPACRNPSLRQHLAKWGRKGILARAIHNAYWMQQMMKNGATARKI